MNWLKTIYGFPEHHVSMAWWIALFAVFALGPFVRFAKLLPIWGRKFQRYQLTARINTLERLHQNTFQLLIYLASDLVDVLMDFSWTCVGVAIMAYSHRASTSFIAFYAGLTLASSVMGRAVRIKRLLLDLQKFDSAIGRLKSKQTELSLPIVAVKSPV